MCEWKKLEEEKPPRDSQYLVCAPSLDPDKPLIAMAWYNPETGWSLLPQPWIEAITDWQDVKPPDLGLTNNHSL